LDLADRIVLAKDELFAENACRATTALHRFAHKFLQRYDAVKRERGFLDFDDLIRGTEQLLTNPLVASWVLFKLDGGIDHVLVDEAQDTNPAQWRVIKLLTQNMTESAADGSDRTIFVVGDKKQSIYSFQGAEPDAFDRMKDYYAEFLGQSGLTLNQLSLKHSFRSAPAILEAVDQVFKEVQSSDFTASDHVGFYADLPGRVDIWPGLDAQDSVEALAWTDLSDPPTIESANVLLAEKIALSIQAMIDQEMITDRSGNTRKVHAGDFLILVQRRSHLFNHIITACKRLNLPMAGSDRLKLGGEIAVKDLLALLSFLALPQDSLSLATVLRSPLFGWSEKDLFELSHYRKAPDLWVELVNRAEEFPYSAECLDDLRRKVDFLPPYELLEHILTRWEGRQKLIARLGPEAEEGIDILLNKAREYDASAPASLTGFLAWIEKDETDVKREAETAGKNIRVMTVHGAKGLEAPIVILPDTQDRRPPNGEPLVLDTEGNLLWQQTSDFAPSNQKAGSDLEKSRVKAERLRMLYVAMTRAESWLIVCSAGQNGKGDLGWHGLIDAALTKLNAPEVEMPTGMGRRYSRGTWPKPGKAATESQDQTENNLAPHYLQPIEPPTRPKKPLNPSTIGGEKVVSGADTGDSDAADKGTAIHLLLERSDWIDHERFDDTAQKILRAEGIVLNDGDLSDALKQARSVISEPEFAYLFQPDVLKEVSFSTPASVNGHDRIHGIIDRLVVRPDSVCVVDFKSNAIIPERPEDIPTGLLDQMRAYYLAAASLYPDRRVECAILWTAAPSLMPIPHNIVTAAMVTPSAS
jgi:ATP-dependent helicase/nuclease subunit A